MTGINHCRGSFLLCVLLFLDGGGKLHLPLLGCGSSSTDTTVTNLVAAQFVRQYYEFRGNMVLATNSNGESAPANAIDIWETVTAQAFSNYLNSIGTGLNPPLRDAATILEVTNSGAGMRFEYRGFVGYTANDNAGHDPSLLLVKILDDNNWFPRYVSELSQSGEPIFSAINSLSMAFDSSQQVTNGAPSWQSPTTDTTPNPQQPTEPPVAPPVQEETNPQETGPDSNTPPTLSPVAGNGSTGGAQRPTLPPAVFVDDVDDNLDEGGGGKEGSNDKMIGIMLISGIFGVLAAYCCCYQRSAHSSCLLSLLKREEANNNNATAGTKRTGSAGSMNEEKLAWIFQKKIDEGDDDEDISTLGYPFSVVSRADDKTVTDKTVSNESVLGTKKYNNLLRGITEEDVEAGDGGGD